jgi:hypothetical protein
MSQKISLGNQVVNFAFLGDIEINPNSLCEDQTIPNQVYGSTCNRSSITYNVTGATTGTTYIWGTPTFPLSGSAQPVPQNDFSQGNITVIGNLPAMTPQTGSFSLTGITNGVCSSNPFNVTVYVAPKPYITNKTATINADFVTSGGTFNVVPVYNNATNNVVPSGTTYTWTTTAVSGITGNSNQPIPQTGISQTLITSLIDTPANVVYTVTPSTSLYGTTCVGDPFTVTVTVNPRPLRVVFTYNYTGPAVLYSQIINATASVTDLITGTVIDGGITAPTTRTYTETVDYYYPSLAFNNPNQFFRGQRTLSKSGSGSNFYLRNSYIDLSCPNPGVFERYNIPDQLVSSFPIYAEHNFGPYATNYGQRWTLSIRDSV